MRLLAQKTLEDLVQTSAAEVEAVDNTAEASTHTCATDEGHRVQRALTLAMVGASQTFPILDQQEDIMETPNGLSERAAGSSLIGTSSLLVKVTTPDSVHDTPNSHASHSATKYHVSRKRSHNHRAIVGR